MLPMHINLNLKLSNISNNSMYVYLINNNKKQLTIIKRPNIEKP